MNIDSVMTKKVESCRPEDSLSHAAGLMWDHDCGCVPVVDEEKRVVGMLTDRDVCMAGYFKSAPESALRVADAMATKVVACKPSDSIEAVELLMEGNQIRRVPVVDDGGRLVGIVSLNDLARLVRTPAGRRNMNADALAATLAAVCAPRIKEAAAAA